MVLIPDWGTEYGIYFLFCLSITSKFPTTNMIILGMFLSAVMCNSFKAGQRSQLFTQCIPHLTLPQVPLCSLGSVPWPPSAYGHPCSHDNHSIPAAWWRFLCLCGFSVFAADNHLQGRRDRVYGSHFAERKQLSRVSDVNFPRLPGLVEAEFWFLRVAPHLMSLVVTQTNPFATAAP